MAFLTQLAPDSAPRMEALLRNHLLPGVTSLKVGASGAGAQTGRVVMGLTRQTSNAAQVTLVGPKVWAIKVLQVVVIRQQCIDGSKC